VAGGGVSAQGGRDDVTSWADRRRALFRMEKRLAATDRVVQVAEGLLRYPDKAQIPWTEWDDLREAIKLLKRA